MMLKLRICSTNFMFPTYRKQYLSKPDMKTGIGLNPSNNTIESVLDKYTIDLIVQLANEVGLFKEKLDADDVAARYATDTLRTMTSRNNTRLVVLLDKLASSGIIPYHWQAVIAKKKLVVSSSGRKYLDQHDMSSTLNRSKETPPSISEKHFLAIIDKYIRKIKSKEV